MLKLLIKIGFLFGFAVALIWGLSRFDNTRPLAQESVQRLSVAPEYTDLDYLFVGPSFMYAGLDPHRFEATGHKAFNLGTMDAGPWYCDLIVDDYMATSKSQPDEILLCLSPLMFTNFADVWWRYPFHRYLNTPVSHEQVLKEYRPLRTVHRMYRESAQKGALNLVWKGDPQHEVDSLRQQLRDRLGYTYVDNGSPIDPKNTMANEARFKQQEAIGKTYKDYLFVPRKMPDYLSMIEKWEALGIKVTVVEIPTCETEQYYVKSFIAEYNKLKDELVKREIPLVAKDDFAHNPLYFGDIGHLNRFGGREYTKYVLNKLGLTTTAPATPAATVDTLTQE